MSIYVAQGQKVTVTFTWRNNGAAAFSPVFLLRIRESGKSWTSSDWISGGSLQPGGISGTVLLEVVIPGNYSAGSLIDLEILAEVSGDFDPTSMYYLELGLEIYKAKSSDIALSDLKLVVQ